jgi:hypothetical protein
MFLRVQIRHRNRAADDYLVPLWAGRLCADSRRTESQPMTQRILTRLAVVTGWLLIVVLLGLWLLEAVHRGHAAAIWIVGTGLTALVAVPLLAARHRS